MRHDEIWKWLGIAFLALGGALAGLLLWVCVYGYSSELGTLEDIAYDAYEEDGLDLVIGGNIGSWLFAPAGAVVYPFNRDVGAAILGIRHAEVKIFAFDNPFLILTCLTGQHYNAFTNFCTVHLIMT